MAVLALLVALIGAGTRGFGGFLVALSLFGIGAGIYTLVKRRPSFLNLAPTKRAGGAALGISAALLLVGSLLAPAGASVPQLNVASESSSTAAVASTAPSARPTSTPSAAPSAKKTATPTPTRAPLVTTETVDAPEQIPYSSTSYDEPTLEQGSVVTVTAGVPGTLVRSWSIVTTDGVETSRTLVSETVVAAPVDEVIAIGSLQPAPPPAPEPEPVPDTGGCDPNYGGGCVPVDSDVDCPGGSGNGPSYAPGPVQVIGSDIYDLDRDGDGYACD